MLHKAKSFTLTFINTSKPIIAHSVTISNFLSGNALENGLRQVGREDVVKKTMYNVEVVQDELEAAAARAAMDQSGIEFITFGTVLWEWMWNGSICCFTQ